MADMRSDLQIFTEAYDLATLEGADWDSRVCAGLYAIRIVERQREKARQQREKYRKKSQMIAPSSLSTNHKNRIESLIPLSKL